MMSEKLSRKEFFKESAKYAVGISAGIAGLKMLSNKEARGDTRFSWPWPYTPLDVENARILGHDSFWSGKGCSYGAFHAIIEALRNAIGTPYTELPSELMIYGHGGTAGWGTLCGALNGAAGVISLVCTKADSDMLIHDLVGWYTQTDFPSTISNQYAVNHVFNVNNYDQALPQNQSGSPLCHISVTEWCNFAYYGVGDLERKERCARLTGDVAAQAVKILNDHYNGQFTPVYTPPTTIAACMACHGSGSLDNVAAKMECEQCHGDPHGPQSVNDPGKLPDDFAVKQNYPNPFNPVTNIDFSLPKSEKVSISIYDLNGRHVRTLVKERNYPVGNHTIQWDGLDNAGKKVSSGMYYYRFQAGKTVKTRAMTLIK